MVEMVIGNSRSKVHWLWGVILVQLIIHQYLLHLQLFGSNMDAVTQSEYQVTFLSSVQTSTTLLSTTQVDFMHIYFAQHLGCHQGIGFSVSRFRHEHRYRVHVPYRNRALFSIIIAGSMYVWQEATKSINEPFLFFLSYQWKILMVMMFDADGLNLQRESVVVSAELLMPLCLG